MDLWKILAELREEQTRIEEVIVALERLTVGRGKRRGRPPAWMAALKEQPLKGRGRPRGSKNNRKGEAIEIRSKLTRKKLVMPLRTWRTGICRSGRPRF
jgi:hypothetical protein